MVEKPDKNYVDQVALIKEKYARIVRKLRTFGLSFLGIGIALIVIFVVLGVTLDIIDFFICIPAGVFFILLGLALTIRSFIVKRFLPRRVHFIYKEAIPSADETVKNSIPPIDPISNKTKTEPVGCDGDGKTDVCPKCGSKVLPDSLFCNVCGEALALRCSNCKAISPLGSNFCKKCGRKLN